MKAPLDSPILLYDGFCGFCNGSVQTVLRFDKQGTMRFAALQSDFGKSVVKRHPWMSKVDSVALLEYVKGVEVISIRSEAALRVVRYLGGIWRLFLVAYIIPQSLRDLVYDCIARYRYRIFGRYDSCMLPPAEIRERFLEMAGDS